MGVLGILKSDVNRRVQFAVGSWLLRRSAIGDERNHQILELVDLRAEFEGLLRVHERASDA